jgi:hypothetical protein
MRRAALNASAKQKNVAKESVGGGGGWTNSAFSSLKKKTRAATKRKR